jgi:hypothetical protein
LGAIIKVRGHEAAGLSYSFLRVLDMGFEQLEEV